MKTVSTVCGDLLFDLMSALVAIWEYLVQLQSARRGRVLCGSEGLRRVRVVESLWDNFPGCLVSPSLVSAELRLLSSSPSHHLIKLDVFSAACAG